MLKIVLFCFIAIELFAQTVTLSSGWSMLGSTKTFSSSSLISQSGERLWKFDGASWDYFELGKTGNINAGEAFWLYANSDKEYTFDGVEGNSVYWNSNWSLVSPTLKAWDNLATLFPTASYIWKYNNSSKNWELFTPQTNSFGFNSFENVALGEGVWINSSSHNGMMGESGIQTLNGSFGTLTKTNKTITSEEELLAMVQNQFNIALQFNTSSSNTSQFQLAIRLTKLSTNSTYDYIVKVYNNYTIASPQIQLQNSQGQMVQLINTQSQNNYTYNYLNLLNSNVLQLRFDEIIKNLVYPANDWYEVSEMIDRFNAKTSYKYEIYAYGIDLINSTKLDESVMINSTTTFLSGSSKIEGVLSIQ